MEQINSRPVTDKIEVDYREIVLDAKELYKTGQPVIIDPLNLPEKNMVLATYQLKRIEVDYR